MPLSELLPKALRLFPHREAVVSEGLRLTYEAFGRRVWQLCHSLADLDLRPGDRLAILHENSHVFLEAYLAAAHLGLILVPLNIRLSAREITSIVTDSQSRVLIAQAAFFETVEAVAFMASDLKSIVWTQRRRAGLPPTDLDYETLLARQPEVAPPAARVRDDDVAHLYYTSGTTGRPKGVMLTHKNVKTHALGTVAELGLSDRDVWVHVAPLFHLADAWAAFAITWVGGKHVVIPRFEPEAALAAIQDERVTITNLIPTMLNMMVNHPRVGGFDYSSLRAIMSGGAPIAPELVRRIIDTFHCDYIQTYGMTETSPYLTLSLLKAHLMSLPPDEQLRYKASTGREFITVALRVVDEKGRDVARDRREVGEIIVRGDTVTPGYWRMPRETAEAIRDGWLHTGDLAVIDAEGYVNIVDRKKDMILTGGENVYSIEVENVLYMHPDVLEAAVIGVPDERWGEAVKAVVVSKPGARPDAAAVIAFCKERLAHYKAPKSVDFLSELPKTGSGKITKKALRDPYWEGREKKVQ